MLGLFRRKHRRVTIDEQLKKYPWVVKVMFAPPAEYMMKVFQDGVPKGGYVFNRSCISKDAGFMCFSNRDDYLMFINELKPIVISPYVNPEPLSPEDKEIILSGSKNI